MNEKIVLGLIHVYDLLIDGTIEVKERKDGLMLAGAVLARGVSVLGHKDKDYHNLLDNLTIRANKADNDPDGNHWSTPSHLRPKDIAIFDAILEVKHYKQYIKTIRGNRYFSLRGLPPKMRKELVWDGFTLSDKTGYMNMIQENSYTLYLGQDFKLHIFDDKEIFPLSEYKLTPEMVLVVHHD